MIKIIIEANYLHGLHAHTLPSYRSLDNGLAVFIIIYATLFNTAPARGRLWKEEVFAPPLLKVALKICVGQLFSSQGNEGINWLFLPRGK